MQRGNQKNARGCCNSNRKKREECTKDDFHGTDSNLRFPRFQGFAPPSLVRVRELCQFLKLGGVAGGTVFLGGTGRFGALVAAPNEVPRVDRLVLTNLVDNVYEIFAKGGKIGLVTVTRNTLPFPYGSEATY